MFAYLLFYFINELFSYNLLLPDLIKEERPSEAAFKQ